MDFDLIPVTDYIFNLDVYAETVIPIDVVA